MRNVVLSLALAVLILGSVPGAMAAATETGQPAAAPPQGYVLVEEDVVVVLANEAHQSFLRASDNFAKGKMKEAAAEIRKGEAYVKLEAARATAEGKKVLLNSAQELKQLADKVEKGAVKDGKELKITFARAEYAMARHHYLKAAEQWENKESQKVADHLNAAAAYIDSGQIWLTKKMHAGAADIKKEARRIAAQVTVKSGAEAQELGKAMDNLGKEIEKYGKGLEPARK
jgi:hypothetical protein